MYRSELDKIVNKIKKIVSNFDLTIDVKFNWDALNVPRDHPLVVMAEKIVGHKSEVAPYGTEGPIYQEIGIPTIILGPGKVENNIHAPNEFIEIKQLQDAVKIYSEFIKNVCL